MTYKMELETIKRLHIIDQGFRWYYEIKDNPEIPDTGFIVEQFEDGESVGKVWMPKDCLQNFINLVHEYGEV